MARGVPARLRGRPRAHPARHRVKERVYYPGARRDGGSDGAWLRIARATGRAWTGVFASELGRRAAVGRWPSWPDPHTLVVALGSAPYIVDVRDPDRWGRLDVPGVALLRARSSTAAGPAARRRASSRRTTRDGLAWESDPLEPAAVWLGRLDDEVHLRVGRPAAPGRPAARPHHHRGRGVVSALAERMRWWHVEPLLPLERELFADEPWTAGRSGPSSVSSRPATTSSRCDGDEWSGYAGLCDYPDEALCRRWRWRRPRRAGGSGAAAARRPARGGRAAADSGSYRSRCAADNAPALRLYARTASRGPACGAATTGRGGVDALACPPRRAPRVGG